MTIIKKKRKITENGNRKMESETILTQKYGRMNKNVRERVSSLSILRFLGQAADENNYEENCAWSGHHAFNRLLRLFGEKF